MSHPQVPLNRERLLELIDGMRSRRLVVLGDVMLDRYLIGDTERLSPEAPVPVVIVREHNISLGGAANVAANVAATGAVPLLTGVVGDDPHGRAIRTELAARQIDDRYLVTAAGRPTTTKTRVVARGQQVVRIDEEVVTDLEPADAVALRDLAVALIPEADGLLIEDYNKGTLNATLIAESIALARHRGIPVVVDPKFHHFFDYRGATVFKPNRRELEAALGASVIVDPDGDPSGLSAAVERLGVENLLLTLGREGMILARRSGEITRIKSLAREVYDVSGAGDTVTAWVATALAAGATIDEAAYLANVAAGVEVVKAGVKTVSPEEVVQSHEDRYDMIGRLRRGGLI